MVNLDWKDAIDFMTKHVERNPDDYTCKIIWKQLQIGHRTQDILMTIAAMKSLEEDTMSASPEWNKAIKWLSYQRSLSENLLLDMLWQQLETGNRTDELLNLIRQAAGNPPVAKPSEPIPEVPQVDTSPPGTDF